MIELLTSRDLSEYVPPPDLFTRLADTTISVGSNLAVSDLPMSGKIYLEGGSNFYTYDIATGAIASVTNKRNKNLAFGYGVLIAVPSKGQLYQMNSNPGGIYQPDPFFSPKIFTVATGLWSDFNIGGSASDDYFGWGGVVGYSLSLNVMIQAGGTCYKGAYNAKSWKMNLTTKTQASSPSSRTTSPGNAVTAGGVVGTDFFVLTTAGVMNAMNMSTAAWKTTVYNKPPITPGAGVRCIAYNNKLYFYGGGFGKNLYSFDPAGDSGLGTWSLVGIGGPGGSYVGLTIVGSLLYIFAGVQVWTVDLL